MHGLVNRAIQRFVSDGYGQAKWDATAQLAGLETSEIEPMLTYEDGLTPRLLMAASEVLGRQYEELLEDIGTYIVSHPNVEALRRLLRFGGVGFVDFLHSLDDLPDRARLAVSDLELPRVELCEHGGGAYSLLCQGAFPGAGYFFVGLLRAMADDYGALVFLEHKGLDGAAEVVSISLLDTEFAEGRGFDLGARIA